MTDHLFEVENQHGDHARPLVIERTCRKETKMVRSHIIYHKNIVQVRTIKSK